MMHVGICSTALIRSKQNLFDDCDGPFENVRVTFIATDNAYAYYCKDPHFLQAKSKRVAISQ